VPSTSCDHDTGFAVLPYLTASSFIPKAPNPILFSPQACVGTRRAKVKTSRHLSRRQVKSRTNNINVLSLYTDNCLSEFVSQVVSRIQAGARREEDANERKHLDSAAFWRHAYEKSEAAQSKLLDRVYELEQKLESTSQASKQGTERLNARKRKGEDADQTGEIDGRSKRRKSKVPGKGEGASMNAIDDEFDEVGGVETTDVG
jgi:hypothetical protein